MSIIVVLQAGNAGGAGGTSWVFLSIFKVHSKLLCNANWEENFKKFHKHFPTYPRVFVSKKLSSKD
jgi:hypothetical protein